MSVTVPDSKIAIRNHLRGNTAVVDVLGDAKRVVTDWHAITDNRHWVLLTDAGGRDSLYIPVQGPRIDIACYGQSPWEAKRLMHAVRVALGIDDPRNAPRIVDTGVVITDIQAESRPTQGSDDRLPGVSNSVDFYFMAVMLTVFEDANA